jgi:hypothetical protein
MRCYLAEMASLFCKLLMPYKSSYGTYLARIPTGPLVAPSPVPILPSYIRDSRRPDERSVRSARFDCAIAKESSRNEVSLWLSEWPWLDDAMFRGVRGDGGSDECRMPDAGPV